MEQTPIGGERRPSGAERRESLLIRSVVIPADDDRPLRRQQLDATNLSDYRGLVDGNLEVLSLEQPAATMYLNGDGKIRQLPVNVRATMLLWAHVKELRFQDYIAGDVFLTGPVDHDGWDTSVPDELDKLLDAQRLRIEIQTYGDPQWYGNDLRFDAWTVAYAYALDLARRWAAVEDIRVLPADEETCVRRDEL